MQNVVHISFVLCNHFYAIDLIKSKSHLNIFELSLHIVLQIIFPYYGMWLGNANNLYI